MNQGAGTHTSAIFKVESLIETQIRRLRDIRSDTRILGLYWRPLISHRYHINSNSYEILCSNCRVDIMKLASRFCESRYENHGIFEPWCRKRPPTLSQLSRGSIQTALASSARDGESVSPHVLHLMVPPRVRDTIFLDSFAREFSGPLYGHLKEGEIKFIPKIRNLLPTGEIVYPSAAEKSAIIKEMVKENAAKGTCECPIPGRNMSGYVAGGRTANYQIMVRQLRTEPVLLIDQDYLDDVLRVNSWY